MMIMFPSGLYKKQRPHLGEKTKPKNTVSFPYVAPTI